ncbi:MAG: restriction endonuclease subunit S [Fusobacterium sp.]|uniref:restriction endonuclease subunit S n=1 Tax=Fusobacterium sp. TaxID=68766 RepID=UPI00399BD015
MNKIQLGKILQFQRGYDLTKKNIVSGKYPVITSTGIMAYHNEFKSSSSIVIGRSGTIGKPQLIKEKFWPHNTTLFITDLKENDIDYIYYLLLNLDIEKIKSGSNIPTLNRNHLHDIKVLFEDKIEIQKKISSFLKSIDKKIKLNNKINSELENMAKTIYDYWFLQFEFPNDEGKPYKSSGGKMVWNEELKKEIPEKFNRMVLKNIDGITVITGKTPSTKEEDNFGNDVMFITIEDLKKNTFIVDTNRKLSIKGANTQKNKYIPKGSICVSCIATIGEIAISTENSQTNQQINSIIAKEIKIRNYLYFCLKNIFSNFKVKSGNIFSNMNKEEFENIKILLPNKEVLDKFYERINSLLIKIEKNTKETQELISLRDYLLPLLMNGQVGFKD